MAEVTVKSYSRKGKNGKVFTVKGYSRRVGYKGKHSPKKSTAPGEELKVVIQNKPTDRQMTRKEISAWDAARKNNNLSIGRIKQLEEKSPSIPTNKKSPRKKDTFEKIEDKIAKFVEKKTGKKYKRSFV